MKKTLALLLAAAMTLSLAACGGGNDNTPPDNTDKSVTPGTSTSAPTPGTTPSGGGEKEDSGKAPAGEDSIVMWYGANYYGVHETTF